MMLRELLEQMKEEGNDRWPQRPLPEAQIAELRLYVERANAPCPFKVGDLVKPRVSSPLMGDGDIHIVVEVFSEPKRFWGDGPGKITCGQLLTMRVAALAHDNKTYVAWSVQHGDFEPYTGEGS